MSVTSDLSDVLEQKTVDAHFKHPFTCVVVGPSESGKTTFVSHLLEYLDHEFTDVIIYLGTPAEQNSIFQELLERQHHFNLNMVNLYEKYGDAPAESAQFSKDIELLCKMMFDEKKKLCLVFDDLMSQLADCSVLSDLFTKKSAHTKTSVIYITQNLFHKGKKTSENVTIYRNTKYLVLFRSGLDQTTFQVVAKRINVPTQFLVDVTNTHRYIVIRADQKGPKFTTQLFETLTLEDGQRIPVQLQVEPILKNKKSKK